MQPGLFDDIPERRKLSIEERFAIFDRRFPDVYETFKRLAFQLKNAGRTHYGAKGIMEIVRFNYATSSQGETFKVDNTLTSRFVRKLIAEHPEFRGFFQTRRLQTP